MMTEHDVLLSHVIQHGWQIQQYNPSTKPLEGYLKAFKHQGPRVTRVTWIVTPTSNNRLRCTNPNYTIHFRKH